jgi:transcriptional regulator with XRE-family HTH domain
MNRIRELRLTRGLKQSELAIVIGVNQSAIGKYEREELEPSISTLSKLATFFECSIDFIVGFSDDFGVISINNQSNTQTPEERKLLDTFRKLNTKNRLHVSTYAEIRLEEQGDGAGGRRA